MSTDSIGNFKFIQRQQVAESPTVVRDSNAYYRGQTGLLEVAGPNVTRFLFDDEGGFKGYLIEPNEEVNFLAKTEDFTDPLWVKTNITIGDPAVGPDGVATSATRLTSTGVGTLEYRDRTVGNTTFTQTTGSPTASAILELFPKTPGGSLPYVHQIFDGTNLIPGGGSGGFSWSGREVGDVAFLVDEYTGVPSARSSPWELIEVWNSGGTNATSMRIYWARADSTANLAVSISAINTDHLFTRLIVFRDCVATGDPHSQAASTLSATTTAAKVVDGFSANLDHSLMVLFSTYGNDAATNAISLLANDTIPSWTIEINGVGSTLGNGGGFVIAHGEFNSAGYMKDLPQSLFRQSLFIKPVSGDGLITLYNYRDNDTAVFNLNESTVAVPEASLRLFTGGWTRINLTKDTGFTPSEYGFGMSFEGEILIFGANLKEGVEDIEYLRNLEPMAGDSLLDASGANVIYSNIPEPDIRVLDTPEQPGEENATIWDLAEAPYPFDSVAIHEHLLYVCAAVAGTSDRPDVGAVADPKTWVLIGPTNRWKMLNTEYGEDTATVSDDGIEKLIQSSSMIDAIAVHNAIAEMLIIDIAVPGVEDSIYYEEISLISTYGIDNFYEWFYQERVTINQVFRRNLPWTPNSLLSVKLVNSSGEPVTCGKLVVGKVLDVGITLDSVPISNRDYSVINRNKYGAASVKVNRAIDSKRYRVLVDPERASYIGRILKEIGPLPTSWMGTDDDDAAMLFGMKVNYELDFRIHGDSELNLTIEGV